MNQIPPKPFNDEVQLAIWPCAQQTDQQQRRGRYLPGTDEHPATILPELVRRAIAAYSRPGDMVLDPMCGTGTTLVEAIHLGRRAIGVERDSRWATAARSNLQKARRQGAAADGQAICGDRDDLVRLLAHRARHLLRAPGTNASAALPYGRVDLILTSPASTRPARADEGHGIWARILRPGGFLVLVIDHAADNKLSETIGTCETAGLQYWQHVIALRAAIRDDELVLESPSSRADAKARYHQDVLVFRKPLQTPTAVTVTRSSTIDDRRAA